MTDDSDNVVDLRDPPEMIETLIDNMTAGTFAEMRRIFEQHAKDRPDYREACDLMIAYIDQLEAGLNQDRAELWGILERIRSINDRLAKWPLPCRVELKIQRPPRKQWNRLVANFIEQLEEA